MLFSEIYGNYYHTVAHILKEAVQGKLNRKSLNRIVQEEAFGESMMTIPDALMNGRWGLLNPDYETLICREPVMPLTVLEKRWMKALLLDPRIQLFEPDMTGLEDVQPLFQPDWIVYYDRYTDGDPYADQQYIQNFRCILAALREGRQLEVQFTDGKGNNHHTSVSPSYLEYSEKDDRFRLIGESYRHLNVNVSRIKHCRVLDREAYFSENNDDMTKVLTLLLTDERNALERFLLHFSHLKKETKRLDDKHYQIRLYYDSQDETEMLIRILSFGIWVKVLEPEDFRQKLLARIRRQMELTPTII